MSVVRRRRLAAELRRLREAAGLTCDEVAARLDCSASKISRIETGRVLALPRDVRDILRVYGVPDDQRDSLIQLARDARQKGWWQAYGDTVQPHLATYLGLEHESSEIRIWQPSRVHGLAQTEAYARAVLSAPRVGKVHPDTNLSLELLMERQRVRPTRLRLVLDEASLRHQVGGRGVLRGQVEHLIDLSALPDNFIQVMPYSAGVHMSLDASFTIMEFADPADPDVVCIGYPTGLLWVEDTTEVGWYNEMFRQLQATALTPGDSVAFMTSLLTDL